MLLSGLTVPTLIVCSDCLDRVPLSDVRYFDNNPVCPACAHYYATEPVDPNTREIFCTRHHCTFAGLHATDCPICADDTLHNIASLDILEMIARESSVVDESRAELLRERMLMAACRVADEIHAKGVAR